MNTGSTVSSRKVLRIIGVGLLLYFGFLGARWVWLSPSLVDKRVALKVMAGMKGHEVARIFEIPEPSDFTPARYCAPAINTEASRLTRKSEGGVYLFPLPIVLLTTTTFCFDSFDKLIGFKSARWTDAP
jgi:hypothetical protein